LVLSWGGADLEVAPDLSGYLEEGLVKHYNLCSGSKGHKMLQIPPSSGAFHIMGNPEHFPTIHASPVIDASQSRMLLSLN
jgi:hypothetical protein